MSKEKIGVYIDLSNINQSGGFSVRFETLREFASRTKLSRLVNLNIYLAIDTERAKTDSTYGKSTSDFHSMLRELGYKVIEKRVKWFNNEDESYSKSNADTQIVVDALLQADRLDKVILVTGDGDFLCLVKALQNKGCQVEVIGFKNVSGDLKKEADQFYSGYLIPNLLPTSQASEEPLWGETGSRVRGVCFRYLHDKGYGFMRYLKEINEKLWLIDTKNPKSPYETIFFHESQIIDVGAKTYSLPNRETIFEFAITEDESKKTRATDIEIINF